MFTSAPLSRVQDSVLIEFDLKTRSPHRLTEALRWIAAEAAFPVCAVEACQDLAESRISAYLRLEKSSSAANELASMIRERLARVALGEIEISQLIGMRAITGATPGGTPAFRYVVWTDVDAGGDDELERWYDEEHLPGLAATPGVVSARRFVTRDASPRYYACYDMVSPDVPSTAPWLAVRGTEWSRRVRPTFRNTRRVMSRRLLDEGL
jgi:hypothetical protein